MKVCHNCNREYSDEVNFCTECGGPLEVKQEAEPVNAAGQSSGSVPPPVPPVSAGAASNVQNVGLAAQPRKKGGKVWKTILIVVAAAFCYPKFRITTLRLGRNLGFKALWKDKAVRRRFCRDYYIYTDSDVVLSDDCPADVVGRIFNLLRYKYKFAVKIGLYLRIDDLPDCFAGKEDVVAWEKRYHKPANGDGLYRSPTDTTFAIYRPYAGLNRSRYAEAYRTVPPYSVRHLPWYQNSACLSEEEKYYAEHCSQSTHWTSKTIN